MNVNELLNAEVGTLKDELFYVKEELDDFKDMHKKDTARIKQLESALRRLLEL